MPWLPVLLGKKLGPTSKVMESTDDDDNNDSVIIESVGSGVHTLMDGGKGPPMLQAGCKVMNRLDCEEEGSSLINRNDDSKDASKAEMANTRRKSML